MTSTSTRMDTEHAGKLARAVEQLASQDQDFARFGAASHRYRFDAPLSMSRVRAIEKAHGAKLPEDYVSFVTTVGESGAGPYHGLLPLDVPSQLATLRGEFAGHSDEWNPKAGDPRLEAFMSDETLAGTFALCHMGCTYVALLVVGGPKRGQVWGDFRSTGAGFRPLYESFAQLYQHWIDVMVAETTLDTSLPPIACGLPGLIDKLIVEHARRHDKELGACGEEDARAALSCIPDGAIAFRARGTGSAHYFDDGDPVDVCPSCRKLADHFIGLGAMRIGQIVPGAPPRAARERSR